MILERRTRGQPLLALILVLGGWIGARGYAWERTWHAEDAQAERHAAQNADDRAPVLIRNGRGEEGPVGLARPASRIAPSAPNWALVPPRSSGPFLPEVTPVPLAPPIARDPAMAAPLPAPAPLAHVPPAAPGPASDRIMAAAGHQSLWLAATALLPLPPLGIRASPAEPRSPPPARAPRWSGDAWLLLRPNANTIAPGPRVGTYGASQVGAVLRYRLDTRDAHRVSLYLRATAALNRTRDQEAALGLSARPLARLPVVAMAEARMARDGSGIHAKPALALVTELPPKKLPLGFTGEAYVQAGWVGGRAPTGFVDGLVRAERPVLDPADGFSLRAGGGAWAAKQRGASRVDVGPVASLTVRLSNTASARVEADWRWRVAGRSRPDSGPALTISTGF